MNQKDKEEVLKKMSEISKVVDQHLDKEMQTRENIMYYDDFEFTRGNGTPGLGDRNIYVVEITNQKQKENSEKGKTQGEKSDNIDGLEKYTSYEIYDKEGTLIATVGENGKIHFTEEYLEGIKEFDEKYLDEKYLDDIDFELPEELKENDMVMTKEELREYEEKGLEREKDGKEQKSSDDEEKDKEDEKEPEQETEEEKKEKTAEALEIDVSQIKSICTINPMEKITDKYNLVDLMPEAGQYEEVSIVCGTPNDKSYGTFTMLGTTKDGTRQQLTSIEPVEGTSGSKDVISVNEDGSTVTEKQVQGLFRINSRNRTDGISVSIGDYGMMNVDYVSNVMDKETRRSTPIRTKDEQNQRIATAEVRENAGDSIEEVKKEGEIYRAREEEGVDPQSLDGIDTDQADGEVTLDELKEHIKEEALEHGDMSRGEMDEFIKSEISKSRLELTNDEIENVAEEVKEEIIDESRFPDRNNRI